MKYEAKLYRSPIDLPQATRGKVSVVHRMLRKGERVPVVGFRQALLRGTTPVNAVMPERTRVHRLEHKDYGTWMTDLPEELNQIAELLNAVQPHGRIVVGGLGLGVLAQVLADRRGSHDEITVVERDADVIALCARPERGYAVHHGEIANYLRSCGPAEFFLLDTWQSTSETAWWNEVMPLRRIIRNRFGSYPTVHCWAEDIMQGQIFQSLTNKSPHWYYSDLPMPMPPAVARRFLRDVGLPTWEKRYGAAVDSGTAAVKRLAQTAEALAEDADAGEAV